MTVLVTGGSGQLALALHALAPAVQNVRLVGRPAFDFDRPETIDAVMAATKPRLVINAAAYTAVDAAETDQQAAARANTSGPEHVALLCASAGVPLIHISTDYVYSGDKGAPYVETDPTSPLGVYGATKLAGEQAVLTANDQSVILRTAWVYSATGKNFVKTMLNAAKKTDSLKVVGDQHGCPTTADALATAIWQVATRVLAEWKPTYRGVFHAAGSGHTTWHGLAIAAFAEAARHGLRQPNVAAIATKDWPTPVKRPADSRLDCGKLHSVFGASLPDWRESLKPVVGRLMSHG